MASFIKSLFDKKKDLKYGKGHKLGDQQQAEMEAEARLRQLQSQINSRPQTSSFERNSEAARRAGEAALNRISQQNSRPVASKNSNYDKMRASVAEEMRMEKSDEYKKAQQMKEHYFGQRNITQIEQSSHQSRVLFRSDVLGANEFYPKNMIEDRIEQTLLDQLPQEPLLIATTLLFTANNKSPQKLSKCVEILTKYIDNILKNPNEEKFRKIRVENKIFKENVFVCKYSDLLLKQAGFKAMTLEKQDEKIDEAPLFEDYFVFDDTNVQILENLKEALMLGQPILPELHRDIRVFDVSLSSQQGRLSSDFDLSSEFYNPNIEDMKREIERRNESLEKSGMLRTKAMRERDEQLELRRYNYCLLRIRFPNELILQGTFASTESLGEVYKFVQSCLEEEYLTFELTGQSLKSNQDQQASLAELRLAPAALVNIRFTSQPAVNTSYIKRDLIQAYKSSF